MKTVKELEAELREAKALEAEQAKALRDATPIKWKFTIEPSDDKHHEVYDDSCKLYYLKGEVVNKDEAEKAGHPRSLFGEGGIVYVYNTLSKKLVMHVSGGTIFVSRPWFGKGDDGSADTAMNEINAFLLEHPEGGDITDIVQRHRQRRGREV